MSKTNINIEIDMTVKALIDDKVKPTGFSFSEVVNLLLANSVGKPLSGLE